MRSALLASGIPPVPTQLSVKMLRPLTPIGCSSPFDIDSRHRLTALSSAQIANHRSFAASGLYNRSTSSARVMSRHRDIRNATTINAHLMRLNPNSRKNTRAGESLS